MIKIENGEVYSSDEKIVHRKGTEAYFQRGTVLPNDTADDFEEVDQMPKYTKRQYDEMVTSLVRRRYTESEEFALQRKMINATNSNIPYSKEETDKAIEEYVVYNDFVEQCKIEAKNPDLYPVYD